MESVECPTCRQTVSLPDVVTEDDLADLESTAATTEILWDVATPKGIKRGVSRFRVQAAISSEKLPPSTLIRAASLDMPWQELGTCESFVSVADEGSSRYCSNCDTAVVASEETFAAGIRCPKCRTKSEFIDYLRVSPPPIPDVPIEPWGRFDPLVVAGSVAVCMVGICALPALFVSPLLSVLLSFIFLTVGVWLFVMTNQHRLDASKYRQHVSDIEESLKQHRESLVRVTELFNGMTRNHRTVRSNMLARTTADCNDVKAEAQRLLLLAESHSGTVDRVAQRFLDDTRKWWTQKLRSDNYPIQRKRIEKAIAFVEKESFRVPKKVKKEIFVQLQMDFEKKVREERERERQKQIREQIRAEQRAEREAREEQARAEAEQKVIEAALAEALAKAGAEHSAEVDELRRQLQEAEERGQRAVAQAQLTKVGHVYVISNIGSFGENVYKVGLTRRLEPLDRVKELGDASVPFPFDVHMMIWSEDAPNLEHQLHRALHRYRLNRVNFRKEFFKVDVDTIYRLVLEMHDGEVEYRADPEALEYRDSLETTDEVFDYLEDVAEREGLDCESDED